MLGYKSRSSINKIEKGINDIPQSKIVEFAKALRTTPEELMGWKKGGEKEQPVAALDMIKIPVLGRVVAGDPREAIQEADEFMYIPSLNHRRAEDFFALRVFGESMEPSLLDGDIAIVRIQPDIDSGQIAVVLIDNQDATVKRVFISSDGITLVADNPAVFSPRFFSNEDCALLPVRILGRVISIQRDM
jgi:repressor LexA